MLPEYVFFPQFFDIPLTFMRSSLTFEVICCELYATFEAEYCKFYFLTREKHLLSRILNVEVLVPTTYKARLPRQTVLQPPRCKQGKSLLKTHPSYYLSQISV